MFSSISRGVGTGTKGEFEESRLVPVPNPKSTSFSPLVSVQNPLEIEENSKKVFFGGICTVINSLFLFLDLKCF